jgi:hypothetical protein
MPQVAARINNDHEKWLKSYFKTKSAGAEFLMAWSVDMIFRTIRQTVKEFSLAELKTIIESYKNVKLLPEQTKLLYFQIRIQEACDAYGINNNYGVSKSALERKIARLKDVQAAALMIWSSAYWTSKTWKNVSLEDYVREV